VLLQEITGVYTDMNDWIEIRRKILVDHVSLRELERQIGINRQTLRKIRDNASPPGYRRRKPLNKPKIAPFIGRIRQILEDDKQLPRKQRHTAKRIWERLQDEGFTGGYTIVKDAVRQIKQTSKEVFMPLSQRPGEAQVDFGHGLVNFGSTLKKVVFFVMTMVHSDAIFMMAFPRECTEAFLEAHVRAFDFFGLVPRRISYDNTRVAITKIMTRHRRCYTSEFKRLIGHHLFEPHFCNVRRPNEKGVVEGSVKYCRLNFMVPVPQVKDYTELNRYLRECCSRDMERVLRGKRSLSKRELLAQDSLAAIPLPDDKFDYRKSTSTFVSSESLVRYDTNDYSVPVSSAHHQVTVKASVRSIEIYRQDQLIAAHDRSWDRESQVFEPMHYLELLRNKPGSLDHSRALEDWHLPECFNQYRKLLEDNLDDGTREYIRVLQLLRKYPLARISRGIKRALECRVYCYEGVLQFLLTPEQYSFTPFNLAGREHLRGVAVNKTSVSEYASLSSGGEHVFTA
jgi:transposase